MAVRTIDKFQVMAQCVHIIRRQLRSTRNPKLRTALEDAAEHFGAIGRVEEYRMIVYADCIYLVHDDFKNEPNLKLSKDGKLYIGKLDICLIFNDRKCIRIHGDGTADCGWSMHGFMTGECITERVEYENGKEKRFCYDEQPLPPYLRDGARVNNDNSLGFFGRIRHNRTIGRKDFLLGLLSLLAVYYVVMIFTVMLAALAGGIGAVLTAIAGVFVFVLLVMLVAKRVGDIGYFGGMRVALVLLTLFFPIMFIVLLFVPTKVLSDAEYEADKARWQKRVDEGERALARRCDVVDADIDWFRITPEVKALANRLAGRASGTPSPSYPDCCPDDDRAAEEDMRRREEEESAERERMEQRRREEEERMRREDEERDREQRRDAIRREIDGLRSELSREESKLNRARSEYDRAKQQADTYLSYARSTDNESIRRDYEQSAEGYLSDARSAERDMSDAERNIDDLRNRINSLESDMRSV